MPRRTLVALLAVLDRRLPPTDPLRLELEAELLAELAVVERRESAGATPLDDAGEPWDRRPPTA